MNRFKYVRSGLALALCAAMSLGTVLAFARDDRPNRVLQSTAQSAAASASPSPAPTPGETSKATEAPAESPTPTPTPAATQKSSATEQPTAKPTAKAKTGPYSDEMKIARPKGLKLGGAAAVERKNDVASSPYYKALDIYNMKSGKTLLVLPKYKTYQQTTEWSSGPAAALTVLNYYGKLGKRSELDLAKLRKKQGESNATLSDMIAIFQGVGGFKTASTFDSKDTKTIGLDVLRAYLEKGVPVLVEWADWDGHWQVVIGYNTMGTDSVTDDVLIVADPYDTTDHCQDGYGVVPAERFLFMWKDTKLPKGENNKVFLAAWPEK